MASRPNGLDITFNFIDVSPVKLPEGSSDLFGSDLTSLCTGSSNLFIGTTDGFVHIISSAFRVVRSFKAHDAGAINHMKQIKGTSLLVTVAEDLLNEPVLKVWALDTEKKDGGPRCLSTVSIQNARRQFPISAFAVVDDLSQVAVGFANGSVTIIRGDLIHDRGARQRIVFESEEPITGLETQEGVVTVLYISTTSRILTLVIAGRGQGQPARVLEDSGCALGCMTLNHESGDILIAREDAIYTYGLRGARAKLCFRKPENIYQWLPRLCGIGLSAQSGLSKVQLHQKVWDQSGDELFGTTTFTLLDTDLKFIAHNETLISPMKRIFIEWGDLFVLTTDGKVFRYKEKSLQQRLEILYDRNLYILAINLAQKIGIDPLQQNAIYRKYGDFLYQRGDYDTAMQQYLRAIDNTEPSQVIRRYLDTQRIHNLIEYLEELHDHGRATVDHTTLLLNCYAKLKDTSKLDSFIKAPGELKFDLETAIAMCRQGGYYEQAAYLATKHGENDMVVDILIEDSKKYAEAVEYIWRLKPEVTYHNLMKYARVLLAHCPKETTELFKMYYTGKYQPRIEVEAPPEPEVQPTSTVQSLAGMLPLRYVTGGGSESTEQPGHLNEEAAAVPQAPPYTIPKARTAFSAFVDHPQEFIDFLETLVQQPDLKKGTKIDLFTTLFEMYLDTAKRQKDPAERLQWEAKARKLIEGKDIPISTSNVLLLSDLSNFREGSTLVREQEGLHLDIFRSFTSAKDTQGAIKALRRYGPDEPQLYVDALTYFASSPQILEEAGDELDVVLRRIDEDGLLSPLQVIQALSNNAVVTMGRVKKYLSENIERERKEIATNRRLISSYKSETAAKQQELESLASQPVVFQSRRCQSCGGTLDLPTVHFLCKHSFHERCLNRVDDDAVCPVCAPTNSTLRAIRQRQVESADQHDLFKSELQRARDRFGVVSDFFGRGVMRSQSTLDG
ncbi:Zinc finger RING-type [Penicillium chermesinum]|uniref:E3 ubiquitin-protein ligase PEP5 n=1 Tax=Penicillium chermesinum TaxID=63820 RepID=A0A9W9P7J5_9EURO|nr:Zinc finger RING-type [Penicillium chermesinum]KAJ5239145.1 Zinc finger RING-type [Penicillium chermesinum]